MYNNLVLSGWLPGRYQAEPTGKKKERCLYLSNTFKHPNGSDVSVGYHFWLNDRCSSTKKRLSSGFRYICERAPEWTDVGMYLRVALTILIYIHYDRDTISIRINKVEDIVGIY
jgi:hypothetical protein